MAEVIVEIPGESSSPTFELVDGEAVLVGREPDPARLAGAEAAAPARTMAVPAPSISANHVLIDRRAGTTTVVDLRSRNGTWLRLPAGDRVEVRSQQPLLLRLSSTAGGADPDPAPDDASWSGPDDYHRGIAASVVAWLERRHVPARVSAQRRKDGGDGRGAIPLANGFILSVVPHGTVDDSWEQLVETLWRYVNAQNLVYSNEEDARSEGLILASPAIRKAHRRVVDAAERGLRLLLVGPSGAGKDGLARCYHRHTGRTGLFVTKNCSMFTRDLLRVELFGAEQGAFTTAVRRIIGAVERAHGGTLFLDEIGDMALDVQAMLLTFLDRGEFERLGQDGPARRSDLRVVSATNQDLRAATERGDFRRDLWYRLAGCVVEVPPLRERPEDLEGYLRRSRGDRRGEPSEPGGLRRGGADADGRDERSVDLWDALAPGARAAVLAHPWQGNFRELASFVEQLPRPAAPPSPGSIDEATCAEALRHVALGLPAASPAPSVVDHGLDLDRLSGEAARAFVEDFTHPLASWDDVKTFLERYLKPLLFAQLSGATRLARLDDADIHAVAASVDADRGTAGKQLARYFERFVGRVRRAMP
jgi:hypothetical protein